MKPCVSICLALCVLLLGAGRPALGDDEGEAYTALKHDVLFLRAGLKLWEKEPRIGGPGETGIAYHMAASAGGLWVRSLQIAVFTSRAAAEDVAERMVRSMSMGEDVYVNQPGPYGDIGDERHVWNGRGEGGSLVFLRQNISVVFSWAGESARALALARRIDELIRTDREVAPRGRFAPTPEIVTIGVPAQAAKKARLTITPEFRGLGERADLRITILAPDRNSKVSETTMEGRSPPDIVIRGPRADSLSDTVRKRRPDEDGRFILHIPDKVGPAKLTMIVATADNVIVTKEFTVNVTE